MAMHFKIITPMRCALETEALWVRLPGSEGEMEILPGHADLISSVSNGELSYRRAGGSSTHSLFVGGGFLQVENDHILLVTDTALKAAEIDSDTVQKALERAQEALRNSASVISREEQTFLEASIAKQLALLDYQRMRRRK